MFVRVAVSDPLPVFRRGLLACVAASGYEPESADDLMRWADTTERQVAMLTLRTPQDWQLLTDLCRSRPQVIVIAVLDDATEQAYVRAFEIGAAAVVPRDAPAGVVREAFEAALTGRSILPTAVLRALATEAGRTAPGPKPVVSVQEIEWLRHLAQGLSVGQLAEQNGYSERMMFRMLRGLYTKLNTNSRVEALMRARDEGWV
jgi:DNA-binding NarL/FixJ family response regulator